MSLLTHSQLLSLHLILYIKEILYNLSLNFPPDDLFEVSVNHSGIELTGTYTTSDQLCVCLCVCV